MPKKENEWAIKTNSVRLLRVLFTGLKSWIGPGESKRAATFHQVGSQTCQNLRP